MMMILPELQQKNSQGKDRNKLIPDLNEVAVNVDFGTLMPGVLSCLGEGNGRPSL